MRINGYMEITRMKVYDSIYGLDKLGDGWAVSIGNFDGFHLGHQELIAESRKFCKVKSAADVAVVTFDPHPAVLLHPKRAPGILTPLALKRYLLEKAGVDVMVVIRDSIELLNLSPEKFVDDFLIKHINPSVIVEGPNFNFGYGRSGNVETLKELAETRDFEVLIAGPKNVTISDGQSVMCSSSVIRHFLDSGNVEDASIILGRNYRLIGQIIAGRGIGRKIGFPTTNINPDGQIIPAEGVYAGFISIRESYDKACGSEAGIPAVFSIGRAKTFFGNQPLLVEAHILTGNQGDLYGKWLSMDFVKFIRHQQRFSDHETLAGQIAFDCSKARDILGKS